jgi:hypothetical protein
LQQWKAMPTSFCTSRHLRFLQHFRFPLGRHTRRSFVQRFFFFFLFLAAAVSGPAGPEKTAAKPAAARPKRRRVQASNRDPSMRASR